MSIAAFTVSEAALAAQIGAPPIIIKKPPPKRFVVAIADTTQTPEPR